MGWDDGMDIGRTQSMAHQPGGPEDVENQQNRNPRRDPGECGVGEGNAHAHNPGGGGGNGPNDGFHGCGGGGNQMAAAAAESRWRQIQMRGRRADEKKDEKAVQLEIRL